MEILLVADGRVSRQYASILELNDVDSSARH